MSAFCSGNPGVAKPGLSNTIFVAPAAIGALLNNVPVVWAVALAAYLAQITYDLTTFCPGEPPAVPTITAADALALLSPAGNPNGYITALAKFQQLVGAYAWFQFCQCTVVATPAPPAAPAPPANLPQINPVPITQSGSGACQDLMWSANILSGTFNATSWLWHGVPANLTSFRVTIKQPITGMPQGSIAAQWTIYQTGNGSTPTLETRVLPLALQQSVSFPVVAGATELRIYYSAGYNQTDPTSIEIEGFCGGAQPGTATPGCCPPDALLNGQLSQILQLVTLMQRQLVPFAYVSSTTHPGLTGQGTIAIQGLLGLRIQLTTYPVPVQNEASTPTFLFSLGWVSLSDANGFIDETRAHAANQVWFSRIASDATLIGYSFPAGVVATITELQREP